MIQKVVHDVRREIITEDESDDTIEFKLTEITPWPDACNKTRFYEVAVQTLRARVFIPRLENGKEVAGDSRFKDFCDKYREDGLKLLVYEAWRAVLKKEEKIQADSVDSPEGHVKEPHRLSPSPEARSSLTPQGPSQKQEIMTIDYILSGNSST